METLKFAKMNGTGNDFVVFDNRAGRIKFSKQDIVKICRRKFGIDADGLLMIEKKKGYDFYMRFYNNDGSEAGMCGNGSRCICRFAYLIGAAGRKMSFCAKDGPHRAEIMAGTNVRVLMSEPHSLNDGIKVRAAGRMFTGGFVNTGVPHFVIETKNIDKLDIVKTGREIRFSKMFAPAGTNVMFIEKISADKYRIRSYERGVEDETLACGTGATASAIILASRGRVKS
ncbi:MAG: diaminopimelate epimerase, partial [Spirochaetia bacterium]|nr:diaminopimelate epimerase [Spirochaetia bacterium]